MEQSRKLVQALFESRRFLLWEKVIW